MAAEEEGAANYECREEGGARERVRDVRQEP